MKGRRGGTVVPEATLDRLERRLLRNRVTIARNADQMLANRSAVGIFRVYQDGSASIFLRSDPTRYEISHELKHYEQFRGIGALAYRNLTRLRQEQYVYDALRRSHVWRSFSTLEVQHAMDYIRRLGGSAW